jgi:hypothetical protein
MPVSSTESEMAAWAAIWRRLLRPPDSLPVTQEVTQENGDRSPHVTEESGRPQPTTESQAPTSLRETRRRRKHEGRRHA